jgi:hypothetical protein
MKSLSKFSLVSALMIVAMAFVLAGTSAAIVVPGQSSAVVSMPVASDLGVGVVRPFAQPFVRPFAQPFVRPFAQPFFRPFAQPFFRPFAQPFFHPFFNPFFFDADVDADFVGFGVGD